MLQRTTRLLQDCQSTMPADRLLPQSLVPESRSTAGLLHSLGAGSPYLSRTVHDLPPRSSNVYSPSPLHDLPHGSRMQDLSRALPSLPHAVRTMHSQSSVHDLLDATGMPNSQGAICDLLVYGKVHHQESAVHDLYDGQRMPHSQSSVHCLSPSAVHTHGNANSLRGSASAGQAKLLRPASCLQTSASLLPVLSRSKLPNLHGRRTGLPNLWPRRSSADSNRNGSRSDIGRKREIA